MTKKLSELFDLPEDEINELTVPIPEVIVKDPDVAEKSAASVVV